MQEEGGKEDLLLDERKIPFSVYTREDARKTPSVVSISPLMRLLLHLSPSFRFASSPRLRSTRRTRGRSRVYVIHSGLFLCLARKKTKRERESVMCVFYFSFSSFFLALDKSGKIRRCGDRAWGGQSFLSFNAQSSLGKSNPLLRSGPDESVGTSAGRRNDKYSFSLSIVYKLWFIKERERERVYH